MRILDKYILKELTLTFLAVLIVLLLITFGSEATRLLAQAMQGKIPSSVVLQLLFLKIPPALEIILPLVALLAVILAFGRLYQDQEMVVLQSCGIEPRYFKKKVLVFLIPVAFLMAWISLYVTPWTYHQERSLISQAQTVSPVTGLVAGKFNPLPNKQGVIYAKEISENGELSSIWLKFNSKEKDLILIAPKGRFEWIKDRVVLVMEDGLSYQGMESGGEINIQAFNKFEGYLPELTPVETRAKVFEKPTSELWASSNAEEQAIMQWRLVTPIGVLILGLIGLKMSRTGPREGRFAKIFMALMIYILFNQLLVVGRDGMTNGDWPLSIGLWPVVALFAWFALFDLKIKARLTRMTRKPAKLESVNGERS